MFNLPSALHDLELTVVRSLFPPSTLAQFLSGRIEEETLRPFGKLIVELSNRYVDQIASKNLLSDAQVKAYCLYYLPINFIKCCLLLSRLEQMKHNAALRILDFGCGPGTFSLAALAILGKDLHVNLVDVSKSAQKQARTLCLEYSKTLYETHPLEVETSSRLHNLPLPRFDLILCGNIFNELPQEESVRTLENLVSLLSEKGTLCIIEPGTQPATRQLMHYRNHLLIRFPDMAPLFPCPHRRPCPMLENSDRDWCHATVEAGEEQFFGSQLIGPMCKLTGFNKHRLKYAGFIFQRNGMISNNLRVITKPVRSKRGMSALMCGEQGYGVFVQRKGVGSTQRKRFSKFQSFDSMTSDVASQLELKIQ